MSRDYNFWGNAIKFDLAIGQIEEVRSWSKKISNTFPEILKVEASKIFFKIAAASHTTTRLGVGLGSIRSKSNNQMIFFPLGEVVGDLKNPWPKNSQQFCVEK